MALYVFGHRITSPARQRARKHTVVEQQCEADQGRETVFAGLDFQFSTLATTIPALSAAVDIVVLVIRVYKHIQPSPCYMRRVVDMFCLDVIVNSTPACMYSSSGP